MNEILIFLIGSFIVGIGYLFRYLKTRSQVFFAVFVLLIFLSILLGLFQVFSEINVLVGEVIISSSVLTVWVVFAIIPLSIFFKKRAYIFFLIGQIVGIIFYLLFFLFFDHQEYLYSTRGVLISALLIVALYVPIHYFYKKRRKGLMYYVFFVLGAIFLSVISIAGNAFHYFTLLLSALLAMLIFFFFYRVRTRIDSPLDFFGGKNRIFFSLMKRILTLVILVTGVAGIMITAIFFVITRDLAHEESLHSLETLADSVTFAYGSRIDDASLHLAVFSERSEVVEAFKKNQFSHIAVLSSEVIKASSVIQRVDFLDENRNTLRTYDSNNRVSNEIIDNDLFTYTKDNFQFGFDLQRSLMVSRVSVVDNGTLLGYIDGYLDFKVIGSDLFELASDTPEYLYFTEINSPYYWDGETGIVDTQASITTGYKTCTELYNSCTQGACTNEASKNIAHYIGIHNEQSIGHINLIKGRAVCIVSEIAETSVGFAPSRTSLFASGTIFALPVVVFGVSAYYLTRSITRPLVDLTEGVRLIERGKYSTHLKIKTNDEVFALAKAFNSLIDNLKKSQETVHAKIENKTLELEDEKKKLEKTQKAMLNVLQDVNIDKERLSHEKEKIEVIVQSIKDGFIFVDMNLNIVIFNLAAEKITGHNVDTVINKPLSHFFTIYDEATKEEKSLNLKLIHGSDEEITSQNVLLENASKLYTPIRLTASAVIHKDKPIGFVVIFQDVTREIEIEKMKSNFVSIVSHQLRTPLSAIKWLLEMVLGKDVGEISDEQEDYLTRAYDSNERMIVLVSELLKVSRLESGKIKAEPKTIQIQEIVERVLADHVINAKAHNTLLSFVPPKKSFPIVEADPTLIENVLDNFISNAIDYAQPQKQNTIEVLIKVSNGMLIVGVKDEGIGIEKKDFDKVFGMFFRGDNATKARTDGSGLGLYIAKLMVELSDGKIWFESKHGKGSTFYFSLPIEKKAT